MNTPWINTLDYTIPENIAFALGCLMWVIVYIIIIQKIRKIQFIEIPMIAICANFAWEFLWSWVFTTNMGLLYVWGYRIWFFLDCFIVYSIFRYGYKQLVSMPKSFANGIMIGGLAACFFMLYFYIKIYDAPISHMGAYSGYVLSVLMSALFISLLIRKNDITLFSEVNAWLKFLGTLLVTVFCFMHFTDWFLLSMGVVTAVLDVFYLTFYYRIKQGRMIAGVVQE